MDLNERRRGVRGALAVVVAAVFVLAISAVRQRSAGSAGVTPISERHAMVEVPLETLDGSVWRLGGHRGQVIAINLWATWCGPCREEIPALVRTVRELGPAGFAVVGVSMDSGDRKAKVRAFTETFGVNYPMAFPDAMSQMNAALEGIPTTILIDRQGRVAKTYVGELRESVLRADVTALLREP